VSAVTLEEVKNSKEGYQYWVEFSAGVQSGYASATGRQPTTPVTPATKPKANPRKTKSGSDTTKAKTGTTKDAENEKLARALLASYQLSINAIQRVQASVAEKPEEWAWSAADCSRFEADHKSLQQIWETSRMTSFVQDLRAAVFSPQAVKNFKKKYDSEYGNLLGKFLDESKPKVYSLETIIKQLEDTAKVRGVFGAGNYLETPKKSTKRSGPSASSSDAAASNGAGRKRAR
jgi:hypothetical protein